jgi:hypothetical protein
MRPPERCIPVAEPQSRGPKPAGKIAFLVSCPESPGARFGWNGKIGKVRREREIRLERMIFWITNLLRNEAEIGFPDIVRLPLVEKEAT